MEIITFSMRLQQSKFNDIWKQWKMYISLKQPSFVSFFFLYQDVLDNLLYCDITETPHVHVVFFVKYIVKGKKKAIFCRIA